MAETKLKVRILGDASDFTRATDKGSKAADKMADRLDGIKAKTAVAGAAAGAALMAGLNEGMEQEASLDKLEAQLGAGSLLAEDAGKVAGNLWASAYGDSMAEAADSVKAVMQSGLLSPDEAGADEIEHITQLAMSLAETFDQDVKGTAEGAAQMIKTGLAGSAEEAFDLMTRGFQQGVDKGDDLVDTLNEYGTQFRKMGIDGEEAIAMLAQGIGAGARNADIVADSIMEFSIKAIDGSKSTRGAFEDLGMDAEVMASRIAAGGPTAKAAFQEVLDAIRDVDDPLARANIAVGLFGTKAEDMGDALFALDPATATLGDIAGKAQEVNDTIRDNPRVVLEQFKREAIDFGMRGAAAMVRFTQEHRTMTTVVGGALAAMLGIYAAVKVAQLAMVAVQGLQTAATVIGTAAQWAMNTALISNPIGVVVMAIAALVAALVWFVTQTELGRRMFDGAMQAIRTAIFQFAVPAFQMMLNHFMLVVGGILNGAAAAFGWVPGVGPKLRAAAQKFNEFRNSANAALNGIRDKHVNVTFGASFTPGSGDIFRAYGQGAGLGVLATSARAMAEGGIVRRPTLALIGEAGPEKVEPLDEGSESQGRGDTVTIHVTVNAGAVGSEEFLVEAVSDAVGQVVGQGRGTKFAVGV